MNPRTSKYCAVAALVAVVIYGLACVYPAAWSPGSDRVVFLLGIEEGSRLVMTDLSAGLLREVDRVDPGVAFLGAATWSPDGKWLAYMKVEEAADEPEARGGEGHEESPEARIQLMLQDAASGAGRAIWAADCREEPGERWGASLFFGPRWTEDSEHLSIVDASASPPEFLLLDLEGRSKRRIPVPDDELVLSSIALSPDARRLAWVEGAEEQSGTDALKVRALDTGEETRVALVPTEPDLPTERPAWSSDGRHLYFAGVASDPEDDESGLVNRWAVDTGAVETVWRRAGAQVLGIDAARHADLLAVDYMRREQDELMGVVVVDLRTGESTPVHFGGHHFGTSISPDGRWVALVPMLKASGEGDGATAAAIVAADGSDMRLYLPPGADEVAAAEVTRARLKGALLAMRFGLDDSLDVVTAGQGATPEALAVALKRLGGLAGPDAPRLFRESVAWARAALSLEAAASASADRVADLLELARGEVESFRTAYPGHLLMPGLEKQLEELSREVAARAEPD